DNVVGAVVGGLLAGADVLLIHIEDLLTLLKEPLPQGVEVILGHIGGDGRLGLLCLGHACNLLSVRSTRGACRGIGLMSGLAMIAHSGANREGAEELLVKHGAC